MKTFISAVSIIILLALTPLPLTNAIEFTDVSENHPQHAAIEYLSEQGIMKGQAGGKRFTPIQLINRAEWAEILVRQSDQVPDPSPEEYQDCFFDVSTEWFAKSVCFARDQGWIKGYQAGPDRGKFVPTNVLNLAEIVVTLSRAQGWETTEGTDWFSGAVQYAKNANLVSTSTKFDEQLTRAQAAEILFRTLLIKQFKVAKYDPVLIDLLSDSSEQKQDDISEPLLEEKIVRLSASPETPTKTVLARGAWYVPVLQFQLEADHDVTLQQISVRRISVGKTEDLAIGRWMINGKVVRENSFSGEENSVFLRNNDIPMKAGEPLLIELNVDFVENAQPDLVYQFETDPSRMLFAEKEVRVKGEKITGKIFSISREPVDQITISNPTASLKLPYVETNDQIIGKLNIKAGLHQVIIKRIRFEDDEDLTATTARNFRLMVGRETVASIPEIERSALDFSVKDYLLEAGEEKTFTVMADILKARKADKIRLYIEEAKNVHAFDLHYGFGTRVENQFTETTAWCLGSRTAECPPEGFRKRCSIEDREERVIDCY